MKWIKLYEEWSDDELSGLLGNLEDIGAAEKIRFSLWMYFPSFIFATGYIGSLDLLVTMGKETYSGGGQKGAEMSILNSLISGDFERPEKPGFNWKSLSVNMPKTMSLLQADALKSWFSKIDRRDSLELVLEKLGGEVRNSVEEELDTKSRGLPVIPTILWGNPSEIHPYRKRSWKLQLPEGSKIIKVEPESPE